jgi:urocanate hydratase
MSPREYLIKLEADKIPHGDRTLYEHLCNTEDILRIARLPEEVQKAGLYHSIYGTNVFEHKTTSDREVIKKIIGEYAEYLAWIFCNANRPFCWFCNNTIPFTDGNNINISDTELFHLRMIESANLIDQQSGADLITTFTTRKL